MRKFVEPSMGQMRKFFEMIGQEQMTQQLLQFFIEDPRRILETVEFRSPRACDMPTLSGALVLSSLQLDDRLREEDIPWQPESNGPRNENFACLRVERASGRGGVHALEQRLGARCLLPGTLSDLLRLARWDEGFYWEIPVVALGTSILRKDMGQARTYYPIMGGRTLFVVSAEVIAEGDARRFYLGRIKP